MTQWNDPQGRRPEDWEVQQTQAMPPAGQQPGYPRQQPGYPPQQGQPSRQPPINPFGTTSNESFGIAGTVLALLAGVVGIVSFTALDWFTATGPQGLRSFSDLHDAADRSGFAGFASAYFSYLAWLFLIITVLAAVGSSFPSPAVRALRIIGVVVGVAAAGLSFLAIRLSDGADYSQFIKHASVGFYLAVIAFLLAAVGAAIGPSRVAAPARRPM